MYISFGDLTKEYRYVCELIDIYLDEVIRNDFYLPYQLSKKLYDEIDMFFNDIDEGKKCMKDFNQIVEVTNMITMDE